MNVRVKPARSGTILCSLLVSYLVVLPLVAPFGVGIHVAGSIAPSSNSGGGTQFVSPKSQLPNLPTLAQKNKANTILRSTGTDHAYEAGNEKDAVKQRVLEVGSDGGGTQNDKHHKKQSSNTKDIQLRGEHESNIISRLLYLYVSPLLQISSQRQLDRGDVLSTPSNMQMNQKVPQLKKTYEKCRTKALTRLENLRSATGAPRRKKNHINLKRNMNDKIAKSESLILAKALFLHQRRNLALTACLRLANTAIQAFPAILVARLLRLIEAGDVHDPSKPIRAAMDLVLLLSLKMIVENQYFHNIVKGSTSLRGSLSGMVFDKSLRVSSNNRNDHNSATQEKNDDGKENGKKKDGSSSSSKSASTSVLNLMQSDVAIIENTALQIHTVWGKFQKTYRLLVIEMMNIFLDK